MHTQEEKKLWLEHDHNLKKLILQTLGGWSNMNMNK